MCVGSSSINARTSVSRAEISETTHKRFNSTSERRLYYIDHVPKVPPSSPTDSKAAGFWLRHNLRIFHADFWKRKLKKSSGYRDSNFQQLLQWTNIRILLAIYKIRNGKKLKHIKANYTILYSMILSKGSQIHNMDVRRELIVRFAGVRS